MITHQPYPGDVSDAEWKFVLPYLCLIREDAAQGEYSLRNVFYTSPPMLPCGHDLLHARAGL